jgi:Zn-dependent M16 (insulinase) family peptidase
MIANHGFELIQEKTIPEINSRARLYRHNVTGAELLSLENDDENKVFGITFRTPPPDSSGVAHIMEHSVLCGSRKYPVKEPFVELMKGSLNTFLNAFTFPDKTCYPIASQNLKDFYNLIDVYLDAVFYPEITPDVFHQEGWHYELGNPEEPISFKGVVFNEMKGAYTTPENVLGEHSQHSLFPDTNYSVDSGGDPEIIPNLTYTAFKQFHDTYYHPSNARIFFYGDDDPEERLRFMDEYLKEFQPIPIQSQIPLQERFDEPRKYTYPYDSGSADGETDSQPKAMITVNWLLPEAGNGVQSLSLTMLSEILIGTPASPLRKTLIESGLGEDLTGPGAETGMRQMFFSTGMKGVELENTEKVENLILETLKSLVENGIDPETVEAAMNTVEFLLRENNTGSFPRGLALMLRALDAWLYDKAPIDYLSFDAQLSAIRNLLKENPRYFESLIRDLLVDNRHRTTVTLTPDAELGQQREAKEQERLQKARAEMTPAQLDQVIEDTRALKRRQETPDSPEALETIPMLRKEDLDRQSRNLPIEVVRSDDGVFLYHNLATNGIVYLDLGFNLHTLPPEWLPYIPLFSRALLETGTAKEDFVRLTQHIGRSTGGIYPIPFTSAKRDDPRGAAWLFIRAKAMIPQTQELLSILKDVLFSAQLDNRERIRQMLFEERAGLESGIPGVGHRVVNSRLRAQFSQADWASEQMSGISYLSFLRNLSERIETDWEGVRGTFEAIRTALFSRTHSICNLTLDSEGWKVVRPQLDEFLAGLADGKIEIRTWDHPQPDRKQGLTIPAQINFVGKGANLYSLGYELHGSALVIPQYLRNTWLWDKVRVQGGAYGAFSLFDRQSGAFTFLSYRDPNVLDTLDVYSRSGEFLKNLRLSEAELTKAIIGAIGELDAYQLPDAKGYTSMVRYLLGITDEERQQLRDQVLETTEQDFHAFGETLQKIGPDAAVVILGSSGAVKTAAEQLPEMKIEKVL